MAIWAGTGARPYEARVVATDNTHVPGPPATGTRRGRPLLARRSGFLETAGFPRLSMFWVWGVMGALWGAHTCLRGLFTR